MPNFAIKLGRAFAGLRIRYKLMILHNLFFLVLAGSVWFSFIPLIEEHAGAARDREQTLARELFWQAGPGGEFPRLKLYQATEGSAADSGIPDELRAALDADPDRIHEDPGQPGVIFAKDSSTGLYRRLRIPPDIHDSMVWRSKITLALALGMVYCLAVLALELSLMRLFIYRPLRILLEADEASRRGETSRELIDPAVIQGDELGQLMSSRNATVHELRQREKALETAYHQLEEIANDLQRKNNLLETAKKNIADQDRLASIGMLSAGIAHELNTPLAVLSGSAEKLLETVQDPHSQERLERMLRVTRRLQKMSEDLVYFSHVRKRETERLPVRPLIDEAWNLVELSEKATAVQFANLSSESAIIAGNADRLVQLFVNLIRNALHAVHRDGHIQVSSRLESGDGGEWVVVGVKDDGSGIPPDVLPGIFEAFVTSRLDAKGTGLGLTVAEGIAHEHGGIITAANRPEGGACLEVRFPSSPEPGPESEIRDETSPQGGGYES